MAGPHRQTKLASFRRRYRYVSVHTTLGNLVLLTRVLQLYLMMLPVCLAHSCPTHCKSHSTVGRGCCFGLKYLCPILWRSISYHSTYCTVQYIVCSEFHPLCLCCTEYCSPYQWSIGLFIGLGVHCVVVVIFWVINTLQAL